jgi:hypothetical protein
MRGVHIDSVVAKSEDMLSFNLNISHTKARIWTRILS